MQITRAGAAHEGPVDAEHFNGEVTRRDYGEIPEPAGSVLHVHFPPGARTHWHSHPGGQVLFVTHGAGRVGTRDGEVAEVGPGDVVYAPPNEEHWHGAAVGEALQHLALSFDATRWAEPVEH